MCQVGIAILSRPSLLCLARVFPTPQRWQSGDGVRFQSCITRRDRVGMSLDILDPPCPSPSLPCAALLKVIIVNFHTLKPYYLKKHINISLFYSTQFDSLLYFVMYYTMRFFFLIFFLMIVLLNTQIYYSIFSKN